MPEREFIVFGPDSELRRIAPHLAESLDRYANKQCMTGGFLKACLENNLRGACEKANTENRTRLFEIVLHIYNYLPGNCWGSEEKVQRWFP